MSIFNFTHMKRYKKKYMKLNGKVWSKFDDIKEEEGEGGVVEGDEDNDGEEENGGDEKEEIWMKKK